MNRPLERDFFDGEMGGGRDRYFVSIGDKNDNNLNIIIKHEYYIIRTYRIFYVLYFSLSISPGVRHFVRMIYLTPSGNVPGTITSSDDVRPVVQY